MPRKQVEESERKFRDLSALPEAIVQQPSSELRRSNDALQQFADVSSLDPKEPVHKLITSIDRLQEKF